MCVSLFAFSFKFIRSLSKSLWVELECQGRFEYKEGMKDIPFKSKS